MLHPSTKHLIDRIGDMTANGKLDWVDRGDGTYRFETKGYGVVLAQAPATITILTPEGKTVEQAESAVLAATPHDTQGTYESVIVNLADRVREKIGERRQREEADAAISTILTGLDLDGDGVPDVYVPADEAHPLSAADAVTEVAATDETAIEDDGEETRFSGVETVETVEVAELESPPAEEVSVTEPEAWATPLVDQPTAVGTADDSSSGFSTAGAAFMTGAAASGAAAFGTAAALTSGYEEATSEPGAGKPAPEIPAETEYGSLTGPTPVADAFDTTTDVPFPNEDRADLAAFGSSDVADTEIENEAAAEVTAPVQEPPSTDETDQPADENAARPQTIAFGAGLAGTLMRDESAGTHLTEPEQASATEANEFSSGFDMPPVTEGTDFTTSSQDVAEAAGDVWPEAPAEAGMASADPAPAEAVEPAPIAETAAETGGYGFGAVGQTVAGLAGETSEAVGSDADEASQGVSGLTAATWDATQNFAADVSETAGEALNTSVDTVAGAASGVADVATDFGQTAQGGFGAAAGAFDETIVEVEETVSDNIEAASEASGETIGSFADAAGSTIADATGFVATPEQPVEADTPQAVQPEATAPAAGDNAASGLSSVFGVMGGAMQSAAGSVGEAARNVADAVTGNDGTPAEGTSAETDEDEEVKPDNKPGGRFNPWM